MCLWCQVELRVYRSYEDQERRALEAIRQLGEEEAERSSLDDCPDRQRCLWEKKLEYVTARMQRERLAMEMRETEICGDEKVSSRSRSSRFPAPSLPGTLRCEFERSIESLFDRMTRTPGGSPPRRRPRRKLIPFVPPPDSVR